MVVFYFLWECKFSFKSGDETESMNRFIGFWYSDIKQVWERLTRGGEIISVLAYWISSSTISVLVYLSAILGFWQRYLDLPKIHISCILKDIAIWPFGFESGQYVWLWKSIKNIAIWQSCS